MKKILSLFLAFVLLSVGLTAMAEKGNYFENNGKTDDGLVDVTIMSNVYNVNNGIVSGIPSNTASGIAGVNLKYGEGVVMEKDGQELAPTDIVTTGTVIKQYDSTVLCETAVASVCGDIDGDGKISVTDVLSIAGHITEEKLTGAYGFATDVDFSGNTTVTDIVKARKIIMEGVADNEQIYAAKTYNTLESKGFYKLLGRYEDTANGVTFDWTGSSIEFNAFCEGDITLEINHRILGYTVYLVPIIDGERSYEFQDMIKVNGGTGKTITIAKDLPRGFHNIKLVRNTEVMSSFIDINAIVLNGTLLKAPKDNDLMIEVIGDSISCGLAGRNWTYNNMPVSYYGQASETYAYLTAQNLNADIRMVASSGKSTLVYDSVESLPALVYDYQNKWKSYRDGEAVFKPYNHSNQRDADVIFLALGQNDVRKESNVEPLKNGLKEFANHLRDIHGEDTKIVFIYGMMNDEDWFNDQVFPVVAEDLGGKENGYYSIKMERCSNLNLGIAEGEKRYDSHPTVWEHSYYSEKLTEFMQNEVLK